MCGIVGFLSPRGVAISGAELTALLSPIAHRGPDDEGVVLHLVSGTAPAVLGGASTPSEVLAARLPYAPRARLDGRASFPDCKVALGARRLAIIDLEASGHQPMCTEDGRLWIIYNGEIYNAAEIRSQLLTRGYAFQSTSDTEVLLKAYKEWGAQCLNLFNGMWAFAIWDVREQLLFCARDRFGVKPLYYSQHEGTFIFASEIKALLAFRGVEVEPNDPLIYDFLVLGRLAHTSETCFRGVYRVPPGHYLTVDGGGRMRATRYYSLPYRDDLGVFDEAKSRRYAEQLLALLRDAVRLRLISDVPVALCLSGGLDSSAIVSLVRESERDRASPFIDINPFTITFDDPATNEWTYAERVARHLGIQARPLPVRGEHFWDELGEFAQLFDEPVGSTHIYAKWKLMQYISDARHKVVLDGQGADEALAGYVTYYYPFLNNLMLGGKLRQFFGELTAAARFLEHHPARVFLRALAECAYCAIPLRARGPFFDRIYVTRRFLNDGFARQHVDRELEWLTLRQTVSLQARLLQQELQYSLPLNLHYEDRASMGASIEMRLPFLDYRVVEHVFSIPAVYKIHEGWSKYLLRQAMNGRMLGEIAWRRQKMRLLPPEARWLRECPQKTREYIKDAPLLDGYVDRSALLREWDRLTAHPGGLMEHEIWRLVALAVWSTVHFSARGG